MLFLACGVDELQRPGLSRPPVAVISGGESGFEGTEIRFSAAESSDEDGDSLVYTWTFGDGQSAVGLDAVHAFADDGLYDVHLIVTDQWGAADTATAQVGVLNLAPKLTGVTAPLGRRVGEPVAVRVFYADLGAGDTHMLLIDWGDGARDSVVGAEHAHVYSIPGSFPVRVTLRDDDGAQAFQEVGPITIGDVNGNRAPIANAGGPYEGIEGGPFGLSARSSSDPDGDSLRFLWDHKGPCFLSGNSTPSGQITDPAPWVNCRDDGEFVLTVIVTDPAGSADTATAKVTIRNVAPQIRSVRPPGAVTSRTSASVSIWATDAGYFDTLAAVVDWGDGTSSSSSIDSVTHVYTAAGTYRVRVTVRDGDGGEDSDTTVIGVLDPAARTFIAGYEVLDLGALGGGTTVPNDINNRGQIVGRSVTAEGVTEAFLWEQGTMRGLGTLGRRGSIAQRINETGVIVGITLGAVGGSAPAIWRNGVGSTLGSGSDPEDGSDAVAVTASGEGLWVNRDYIPLHTTLWRNGVMMDLGDLYAGPRRTRASAMNERGQIVGSAYNGSNGLAGDGYYARAWLWENGTMRALGVLGSYPCPYEPQEWCDSSSATDINELGQIVGASSDSTGKLRAVLWENDAMRELGVPSDESSAFLINDQGQVAGHGWSSNTGSIVTAFVWSGGVLRELGSLGGGNTRVAGINESGRVAGVSRTATGEQHVFVWSEQQGMVDLGTGPHGFNTAWAVGINDRGDIIGYTAHCPSINLESACNMPYAVQRAILWRRLSP